MNLCFGKWTRFFLLFEYKVDLLFLFFSGDSFVVSLLLLLLLFLDQFWYWLTQSLLWHERHSFTFDVCIWWMQKTLDTRTNCHHHRWKWQANYFRIYTNIKMTFMSLNVKILLFLINNNIISTTRNFFSWNQSTHLKLR